MRSGGTCEWPIACVSPSFRVRTALTTVSASQDRFRVHDVVRVITRVGSRERSAPWQDQSLGARPARDLHREADEGATHQRSREEEVDMAKEKFSCRACGAE